MHKEGCRGLCLVELNSHPQESISRGHGSHEDYPTVPLDNHISARHIFQWASHGHVHNNLILFNQQV